MKNKKYILVIILVGAALLRLLGLSRGDTTTDEVLYAFRAIGMMDFDEAEDQTTPLEWFDPGIPWWTELSFHDHPPLVFLTQHISMRIFGESNFGFRLPGALLGILSVYLVYCIAKKLFDDTVGLFAAMFFAVTTNHVYISRIGLQESYVIFFILLTSHFFLKSFEKDSHFLLTGAAFGGALLTKYTTGILAPLFLSYIVLRQPAMLKNKKLWFGALLALGIFSPVIIYNIQLWRTVGHFDFQIAYIVGQNPEVWRVAPGKEIGSLADRIKMLPPTLIKTHSWVFLLFSFFSLVFFAVLSRRHWQKKYLFLVLMLFWLFLLLLFIGTSYRFLTLLTPPLAILSGFFASWLLEKQKRAVLMFFSIFVLWEVFYAANTQIFYYPRGKEILAFAPGARSEQANWGYNELEQFLAREFEGKMPAKAFTMRYTFLEQTHQKGIDKAIRKKKIPYSAAVLYDGNVQNIAQLWVLDRWNIYHAWPVVKVEQYLAYMQAERVTDIRKSGFEHYYFVRPTDVVPQRKPENRTEFGAILERELQARGVTPTPIFNKRGEEAFRIYRF